MGTPVGCLGPPVMHVTSEKNPCLVRMDWELGHVDTTSQVHQCGQPVC